MSENEPSFNFQVTFHGLIGLVPLGEGQYLMPIPDLSRGLDASGVNLRRVPQEEQPSEEAEAPPPKLPDRVPPHLACFIIPSRYVVSGHDLAAFEYERPPGGERQLVFRFIDHRLTLEYQGSTAGATATNSPLQDGQEEPGNGAPPVGDLAWMPRMGRSGLEGADDFEGRLVNRELVPGADEGFNRLIGTVLVRSGELGSSGVVTRENSPVVFDFDTVAQSPSPKFRQAMFREMVWHGSVAAGGLDLVLASGDPDDLDEERVELQSVGGRLEIAIHNQELEDILGFADADTSSVDFDTDFAVGYYITPAWDALTAVTAVVPVLDEGIGGSGEACKFGQNGGMANDPRG